MRMTFRFVVPLLIALGTIAYATVSLVDQLVLRWFTRDLDSRGILITNTIRDELIRRLAAGDSNASVRLLTEVTQDEKLFALGVCTAGDEQPKLVTPSFPPDVNCREAHTQIGEPSGRRVSELGELHVAVHSIGGIPEENAALVLIHDMSFVKRRSDETRRYFIYLFLALGLAVSGITVIIAQLSWRGWRRGVRTLLRGDKRIQASDRVVMPELNTLEHDFSEVMREVRAQHGPRDESQLTWTPSALRTVLRTELRGEDIIVVSNREPYIHNHANGQIEVQQPASGLVTALEPVMRACSGTWIAHGSGNADRDVVDAQDRVRVPPGTSSYQIRRIWMSAEEEQGYYYGFANEGLWPLCHIAHVRPVFRADDWKCYVEVNKRFAQAVVEESKTSNPIVLVQDYHLVLVPRMIRKQLPDATIIAFWHIPWPNPESFSICPWRLELLDGLLGSSILGFHTRFHCNNFLDTVDRLLEARVDRESSTVTFGGTPTAIKRYPISIEWPPHPDATAVPLSECRKMIRARWKLPENHRIGIGVDRLDYTKGIIERLRAVERLMELQPEWRGRFTFIQIAAPSRSRIPEYQLFERQVGELADSINRRFEGQGPPPVILVVQHHGPSAVYAYYRAADICFVSSLHDGMNLVAKEFVACRDDDRGVLVLSQFTGAARELPEALIVNPYDTDQCAVALHVALTMPEQEQCARMRLMRGLVQEYNVYRWAGRMLLDAASMRIRGRFNLAADGPASGLSRPVSEEVL